MGVVESIAVKVTVSASVVVLEGKIVEVDVSASVVVLVEVKTVEEDV